MPPIFHHKGKANILIFKINAPKWMRLGYFVLFCLLFRGEMCNFTEILSIRNLKIK